MLKDIFQNKRIIMATVVVALFLIVLGVADFNKSEKDIEENSEMADVQEDDVQETSIEEDEALAEEDEEVIDEEDAAEEEDELVASYPFLYINKNDFSEGRAWAAYDMNGQYGYGVIDTTGRLIYQITEDEIEQKFVIDENSHQLPHIKGSPFRDGLSWCYPDSNDANGFIIVNTDGEELCSSKEIDSDAEYEMVAYGDGKFLAQKHVKNFSENGTYLVVFDKDGNVLHQQEGKINTIEGVTYYGDGIICDTFSIYNLNTNAFYEADKNNQPDTEFKDGLSVTKHGRLIYSQYLSDEETYTEHYKRGYQDKEYRIENWDTENSYGEGIYCWKEGGGYYDLGGNLAVKIPEEFLDKLSSATAFSGGYALLFMRGADAGYYAAVIDREGNTCYGPLKLDYRLGKSDYRLNHYHNGYYQETDNIGGNLVTPQGEVLLLHSDECASIDEDLSVGDYAEGFAWSEQDGYGYWSIDGSMDITSVNVYSGKYAPESEEKRGIIRAANDEPEEKEYIDLRNFTIEGKWKSIGETGFGQAQPGAIVVFDGVNCNFFSPSDTYACYQGNNGWQLDLTSYLFADNLTCPIKIIDEDTIDVFYGTSMTTLKRVE